MSRYPLSAGEAIYVQEAFGLPFWGLFVPLISLASLTSLALLMVFILVNLALIQIKRTTSAPAAVMVYPMWVPVMGVLSCLGLVIPQVLRLLI